MKSSSAGVVALLTVTVFWFGVACSGSSALQRSPTDAGGDAPMNADGAASETTQVATVAGNGAAIPPPDPKNNCGALGIETTPCQAGTMCPNIECDCPTGNLVVYGGFVCETNCVAAVSCAVACEVGDRVAETVVLCAISGLCTTDGDCPLHRTCVRAPGQSQGSCSDHDTNAPCLLDSDCASSACLIESPSSRRCSSRVEGFPCNRDSECQAGRCLFESATKYVGVCSDGTNDDPCFVANDCKPGLRCLGGLYKQCSDGADDSLCDTVDDCHAGFSCVPVEFTATGRKCSAGLVGTRCADAVDCRSGFCVNDPFDHGSCTDGAVGASCQFPTQCQSGFCAVGMCTTGAPDALCYHDEDCATGKCDGESGYARTARCTDGKVGHTCRTTQQCDVGLHCDGFPSGVCVGALANGAGCSTDRDCASAHCRPAPNGSPFFVCAN